MAIATQTMTDEQRKSVALEYLKAFDHGGTTSSGVSILELFAEDAQVYFPKWGVATGKEQIGRMFGDVGATIVSILHDYATFNFVMTGTDVFAVEGTSAGEHRDGAWRAIKAELLQDTLKPSWWQRLTGRGSMRSEPVPPRRDLR